MSFREDIFRVAINNIKSPSFIIDQHGILIFYNNSAEEFIPANNFSGNFIDLFQNGTSKTFQQMFQDCLQFNKSVNRELDVEFLNQPLGRFEVALTPLAIDQDEFITVCSFNRTDNKNHPEILKFSISNREICELIDNEDILRIINEVKSSYPFTFLGKNKIQVEINRLADAFWLKDKDGKYILVNQRFADLLGLKPILITGRSELEFIPNYLTDFYKSVSRFIENTSNIVIREGLPFPQHIPKGNLQVLEIPLCDLDNKVIAILGLTQIRSNAILQNQESFLTQENLNTIDKNNTKIGRGKMYEILLETSPEPMFIYDIENLRFLEVNPAALEVYGYSKEEFLKMDLTDLYAPEDIQTLLDTTSSRNKEGVFTGPWRHKKRDGSSILVEISKTTFEYRDKKAHFNIVRDVTEKNEMLRELQLFRSAFQNTSDMLFVTDTDGFITQVNDAAAKFCGLSKKELFDRPFITLLSDSSRAEVNNDVFHSKFGNSAAINISIKAKDGKTINAEMTASPVKDYNSQVVSHSIIIKPVADMRIQEETSNQPVSALNVENTQYSSTLDPAFLSSVFHEILTPMNVILGFIQELTDTIESPTEEQKEAADIIDQNRKILLQTMDSVLEYSHIEQNRVETVPERVIFTEVLDILQDNTRKLADSNKIEFSYGKISSSLSFETDRHKVESLLSMFISIAMRITKEKKIFLSAYQYDDKSCIISIKDSRNAISDYLLKNLQELFTINESDIKKDFGTSKLTIRLARRLLKLLTGKIEIVKRGGQPVEFGFVFPIIFGKPEEPRPENKVFKQMVEKKEKIVPEPIASPIYKNNYKEIIENHEDYIIDPDLEAALKTDEPKKFFEEMQPAVSDKTRVFQEEKPPVEKPVSVPKSAAIKSLSKVDLTRLKCLYVEDQVDSQILFKVQMKELQKIDFAVSFEAALPLLQQNKYDFIVMDINLQGEYNGLDALRIVRKLPTYDKTHVIAVTAYVLAGDKEKFIAAGFDGFISKPILREKLIEVLERLL